MIEGKERERESDRDRESAVPHRTCDVPSDIDLHTVAVRVRRPRREVFFLVASVGSGSNDVAAAAPVDSSSAAATSGRSCFAPHGMQYGRSSAPFVAGTSPSPRPTSHEQQRKQDVWNFQPIALTNWPMSSSSHTLHTEARCTRSHGTHRSAPSSATAIGSCPPAKLFLHATHCVQEEQNARSSTVSAASPNGTFSLHMVHSAA